MAFTLITITGDYDLANGLDPTGTVTFTPSEPMTNGVETVIAAPVARALNIDGILTILLAANTDPATDPPGTEYTVDEAISGVTRSYPVTIPHNAGSTIDLSTLAP